MRHCQTWFAAVVLCFASTSAVQAQTLFERFGQVLTQQTQPASPAPDLSVPEVTIPEGATSEGATLETLPAPPAAPRSLTGRPTLGVTVEPLTDDVVRERRLPVRSGAVITAIVQDSPADQAGLPLGAVIVALDGRRIDSPADLVAAIRTAPTDREVELSYYEGERLYRKRVHLLSSETTQIVPNAPVRREPQPPRGASSLEQQLGGQGQRPLLGRVGQLLDELGVSPAGGVPFAQPVPESNETALLREQVASLQQEVEALRARLAAIEQQLQRQGNE